jgi:hypothetical protein
MSRTTRKSNSQSDARATLVWLPPLAAVATFIALYLWAAKLYPGGSFVHPDRAGFSLTENYWCDLLYTTSYGGRENRGRPLAIAATVLLSAGLVTLWWAVPGLFPQARGRAPLVRFSGLASAVITPFIATRHHDLAIQVATLSGLVAFVTTMMALKKGAGAGTRAVAWSALFLIVVTYLIWQTGFGHPLLAIMQKGAFTAFLAWVVLVALRLRAAARQ